MEELVLDSLRSWNRKIAVLTGIVLLACAAIVLIDIILRQMGSSFGGTDEISGYVMAIATSWGMSFTLLELGHVRIDLIRGRVGQLGRALFDLFAMAVFSGTISLIAFKCWPVLERSFNNSSRANTGLDPDIAAERGHQAGGVVRTASAKQVRQGVKRRDGSPYEAYRALIDL